jgi:AcrR family transcriptional regulator
MQKQLLSRKEKERSFRRNAIVGAAVGIFAKKGYRDTTLDEIAMESEFGKGTIYNYFKSKEDIYSYIVDNVSLNLYEIIKQAEAETKNTRDFIAAYSRLLINYCCENKDAFIMFVREAAHFTTDIFITDRRKLDKRHKQVKSLLVKKIADGLTNKEIKNFDPQKLATVYENLILPYILYLINHNKNNLDQKKETDFILSVFFNGILNTNKQVSL